MSDQTKTLEINVKGDFHWARTRWEEPESRGLTNAVLSSTGKRALFQYRGEIISVPEKNYSSLLAGPENTVFISEIPEGSRTLTLHKYDIEKRKALSLERNRRHR